MKSAPDVGDGWGTRRPNERTASGFVEAFEAAAASPALALLQRHETRLQLVYQRAISSFKVLRSIDVPTQDDGPNLSEPNEPSPITEHPEPDPPPPPQPADSEPLVDASSSQHAPLAQASRPPNAATLPAPNVPATPPAAPGAPPLSPKHPGGAA